MNASKNSSFLKSHRKRVVLGVAATAGVVATAGALALAGTMSASAATNHADRPGGGPGAALTGTVSDLASTGFTLTTTAPTGAASSKSGTETKAVTVTTNSKTKYFTATTGSASDVKTGVCVSADGSSSTVASVTVSAAVDGKCTTIPAFVASGPGRGTGGNGPGEDSATQSAPKAGSSAPKSGTPSGAPTAGASAPAGAPEGGGQKHQVLSGVVTKVDGSTVTVKTKKGSKSFTVSDSTTYRDVAAAEQSALSDGATAQVTSSKSKQDKATSAAGKVTAKTVTITTDSDSDNQ